MGLLTQVVAWTGIVVLILYVLLTGLGGILETLYNSRLPLPERATQYLRTRKVRETIALLRELSVLSHAELVRQASQYQDLPPSPGASVYRRDVEEMARAHCTKGRFVVGHVRDKEFPYFIDLMSAGTTGRDAQRLARALAGFIKDEMSSLSHDSPIVFDCMVTPKDGTPILGYLVSGILGVPYALWRGHRNPKIVTPDSPQHYLDGPVSVGGTAILVDDSTTGGTMFVECAEGLQKLGVIVAHAFVLFEPAGGGAREVLAANGIELHSILQVDDQFLGRL